MQDHTLSPLAVGCGGESSSFLADLPRGGSRVVPQATEVDKPLRRLEGVSDAILRPEPMPASKSPVEMPHDCIKVHPSPPFPGVLSVLIGFKVSCSLPCSGAWLGPVTVSVRMCAMGCMLSSLHTSLKVKLQFLFMLHQPIFCGLWEMLIEPSLRLSTCLAVLCTD